MKPTNHLQFEIFIGINELSDKELQKKAWIEKNIPNYISSYGEVCNCLHDMQFKTFVERDAYDCGYDENLILELNKLNDLMENYDDIKKTDKQILADPKWDIVIEQAKKVIDLFFKNNPLGINSKEQLFGIYNLKKPFLD